MYVSRPKWNLSVDTAVFLKKCEKQDAFVSSEVFVALLHLPLQKRKIRNGNIFFKSTAVGLQPLVDI